MSFMRLIAEWYTAVDALKGPFFAPLLMWHYAKLMHNYSMDKNSEHQAKQEITRMTLSYQWIKIGRIDFG